MFFLFGSLTAAQNIKTRPKTLKISLTPIGSCRDLHIKYIGLKLSQNESYGLQEPFKTPPAPP